MKEFGPKFRKPENLNNHINDTNKVSSELVPDLELKPENIKVPDYFNIWLAKEGLKSGEKNFSEEHFIEDTIKNNKKIQNEEEIKQAFMLALHLPENRPDMIASLYVLKGDYEEALNLILEYRDKNTDKSLNEYMKDTLMLLLQKKSKEERPSIMEEVIEKNPNLFKYIDSGGDFKISL